MAKESALQGSLSFLTNLDDLIPFRFSEAAWSNYDLPRRTVRIPGFYPSHQWKGIKLTIQRCHVMSCCKLWLFPWNIYIVGVHVPMSPNKIPRQSTNDRMPSSATSLRWGLLEPRLHRLIMVDPRILFSMNPTLMSWWGSHPLTFLPNLHWRQQELPGGATPNLEAGCWHDMLALDSNTDLLTVYAWFLLDRKFFSCR